MDSRLAGILFALTAALMYGAGSVFGKVSSQLNPVFLTALVSVIATVFLLIATIVLEKKIPSIKKNTLKNLLGLGVIGTAIPSYLTLLGFAHTGAASVSFLLRTEAIFAVLLGVFLLKEKISRMQLAGVLLGIVGVFVFSTNFSLSISFGDAVIILATVFWATFLVFTKRLSKNYGPIEIAFWRMLISAIIFVPIALFTQGAAINSFSSGLLPFVLCYALAIYVIGTSFYNASIKRLEIWLSSSITQFSSAITGAVFAIIFLNETLLLNQIIGGAILLVAALLVTRK